MTPDFWKEFGEGKLVFFHLDLQSFLNFRVGLHDSLVVSDSCRLMIEITFH